MNLKRFFLRHSYAIFAAIISIMLVFFILQISLMKFEFNAHMKSTEVKFTKELVEAMSKSGKQINRLQAGISQDNIRRWDIMSAAKIITAINPSLSDDMVNRYATYMVDEVSRHPNVDLLIWMAQIKQESRFKLKAYSSAGAAGIAQLMPGTAEAMSKELGIVYHDSLRYDPRISFKISAYFMSKILHKYADGNYSKALSWYNNGSKGMYNYMYDKKHKNDVEYKSHTLTEFGVMLNEIKLSKGFDIEKPGARYKKLAEMYRGKDLSDETRHYSITILKQAKKYKALYTTPYIRNELE